MNKNYKDRLSIEERIQSLIKRKRSNAIDISKQPTPLDKEKFVDPSLKYYFKISFEGDYDYANHDFCKLAGYNDFDIIGESSDMLTHPDTPDFFYERFLERLLTEAPMRIVSKFIAKDGSFYWLMTFFEKKLDSKTNTMSYSVRGEEAPRKAVEELSRLYKILSRIEEKTNGTEASRLYLVGFLEDLDMTYDGYLDNLCQTTEKESIFNNKVNPNTSQEQLKSKGYNQNLDLFRQ